MAAQKVVISKDLKADLQAFFASMSYDKLFMLSADKRYPSFAGYPGHYRAGG